jgi:hypothetical protein
MESLLIADNDKAAANTGAGCRRQLLHTITDDSARTSRGESRDDPRCDEICADDERGGHTRDSSTRVDTLIVGSRLK